MTAQTTRLLRPSASQRRGVLIAIALLFFVRCAHKRGTEAPSGLGPESFKTQSVEREVRPAFVQAEKLFAGRQYDQAKILYQSVRTKAPKGRGALLSSYRIASIHYYREDYAFAAKEFGYILDKFPRSELTFDTVYNLAACEYQLGQFDRAARSLTRLRTSEVSAQGPRRAELVFQLQGQIQEALGNWPQAINAFAEEAQLPLEEDKRLSLFSSIDTLLLKIVDVPTLEKLSQETAETTTRGKILARIASLIRPKQPDIEDVKEGAEPTPTGDSFRLGVVLPLTGRSAAYGKKALDGILLAAGAFQANQDKDVELIIEDTSSNPALAEQAVETLADQHRVSAILGPLNWKESVATAEKAQALGVPNLSLSAKEGISEKGAFLFQNALTPRVQLENLVRYCAQS